MLQSATTLEEAYKTLFPEPLVTAEELEAFYSPQLNNVRGDDRVARLTFRLERTAGGFCKAFLMGHPGVGKSTELSRLMQRVEEKYSVIRFSVTSELDPISFRPFDVLLFMMAAVAERTARPIAEGGAGQPPTPARLRELQDWFATEQVSVTRERRTEGAVSAGAGFKDDSLWANVLGLFASLKGEIKYVADRKRELVEYRLSRLSTLIDLANHLLDDCNQQLHETTGKEWLMIGEDFDKPGVKPERVEELFLTYANVVKDLRAHLIFTIPIALGYSTQAHRLPAPSFTTTILDTPVFDSEHAKHRRGRSALRSLLAARVDRRLFSPGVLERLVVASGGNLRDLLLLTREAVEEALLGGRQKVGKRQAIVVIDRLRLDYTRLLGESPYDREQIPYQEKAERLVRIYGNEPDAKIPDAVLYSLFHARAVQEFNSEGWIGVHPLVVDILKSQQRLPADAAGGTG